MTMGEMKESLMKEDRYFSFCGVRYRYIRWESETVRTASRTSAEERAHTVGETPPIVLLHGFAQSADSWDEVAGKLASQRVVYALDLVGHGKSDRPVDREAYRIEAQGEMILSFLAHIAAASRTSDVDSLRDGCSRSTGAPVVVGYSMGGRLALVAACRDPSAFGGLVLESTGLGPATNAERHAAAQRDERAAARLRTDGVEAFMNDWECLPLFSSQRSLPAHVRLGLRAGRLANDAEALARTFEGAGQCRMPHCAGVIGSLSLPMLYLAGSKDRKYRDIAEGLKPVPCMQTRIIDGVGHNVHLEASDAFVRAVEAFLDGGD